MMLKSGCVALAIMLLPCAAFAVTANGGDGLPGKAGRPGLPGCPGGTAPSQDGKFYLPGTQQPCHAGKNPSRGEQPVKKTPLERA